MTTPLALAKTILRISDYENYYEEFLFTVIHSTSKSQSGKSQSGNPKSQSDFLRDRFIFFYILCNWYIFLVACYINIITSTN